MIKSFFRAAFFLFFFFSFLIIGCGQNLAPQTYFPETGSAALSQRSLDLRSNLKVLSFALRPGEEDLATLAYFRFGRGAIVMSVYVTNGEAGESDVQGEYPSYLAARRREEAVRAVEHIGGDARFLNLPDIIAARDSAAARKLWPSDSLQFKLEQFISQYKPDLVLLGRDWSTPSGSGWWRILRADLSAAVNHLAAAMTADLAGVSNLSPAWKVSRLAIDDGQTPGLTVPLHERHTQWKMTYAEIGAAAAEKYASLQTQRRNWLQGKTPSYAISFPPAPAAAKRLDEGLPAPCSAMLRGIEIQIEALTDKTLEGNTGDALKRIAALIDSVEYTLAQRAVLTSRERKILLQWKNGLESLRCTVLGVEVDLTINHTLLTDRQLAAVVVHDVKGMSADGATEIFFGGLDLPWAVNEDVTYKLPLKLKEEYRLLTPGNLLYNFPPAQSRFLLTPFAKSLYVFIIHRAATRERNFIYRRTLDLSFGPKFVAEALTPLVRMVPDERVVLRLQNNSHDGIADTVEVADSLAQSFRHPFRLSKKGDAVIDTLPLAWKGNPPDGDHLISVEIDGLKVGQFAARKFPVEINKSNSIALLTGVKNSPTAETLRRLNVKFSSPASKKALVQQMAALSVLIIDRRALTLQPVIAEWRDELDQFVERGGHLLILAQDAESWNAQPLWAGLRLTSNQTLEAQAPLHFSAGHAMLVSPNLLTTADWQDWLFARAYNTVALQNAAGAEIVLRAETAGEPLVVTQKIGQGRKTYVDLALGPQWLNLHAGAFRFLANLLAVGKAMTPNN